MIYATGDTHGNFRRFERKHYHDNRAIGQKSILVYEQIVQII